MEWIDAKVKLPEEECEILFIAEEGVTDERFGYAIPEDKIVLIRRTEIEFDELLYWLPIPELPKV